MFQIIKGDLLHANAAFICHQVNCKNVMGAGVAKALYSKYPEVKSEYHKFCLNANSSKDLLGEIQIVPLHSRDTAVINIFGQLDYGRQRGVVYTDYEALKKAFIKINQECAFKPVAFPYGIGCGLAGGDWEKVERLMLRYLLDCNVKVYLKE